MIIAIVILNSYMKSVALLTGSKGYLASNLIEPLSVDYNVDCDTTDVRDVIKRRRKYNMVVHFAGPSDDHDFADPFNMSTTMVNGTINMLDVAASNNSVFVFASTLGVEQDDLNKPYITYKLAMEHYIKSVYNNYVILRVPRIYSRCRNKGLMKKLREGLVPDTDMNTIVEYLTLDKFIDQTLHAITMKQTTYNYTGLTMDTIADIREKYI